MVFESVFADVAKKLLHPRNFDHSGAAKGLSHRLRIVFVILGKKVADPIRDIRQEFYLFLNKLADISQEEDCALGNRYNCGAEVAPGR